MTIYFFDSSALIKQYVSEPGSTWTRRILKDDSNSFVMCELTISEFASALAQLRRTSRFGQRFMLATWQRFRTDLRQKRYFTHPVDLKTLDFAAQLALRYPLKGCDAIQLAAALQTEKVLQTSVIFVTSDRQIVHAASTEGMQVDNPFDHTGEDNNS